MNLSETLTIDLPETETTAIRINKNGVPVGAVKVDAYGNLVVVGPNINGSAITVDGANKVQIGDANPSAHARLEIDDDVHLRGVLRVGHPDAFGETPLDPDGAIQVGRKSATGADQVMTLFRVFRERANGDSQECWRMGVTKDGFGCIMRGDNDDPMLTWRPNGKLYYTAEGGSAVELSTDAGTLKGQHPETGRVTTIVPR